jgi:predicted regulator of Ras-like GTPase activity (Roadblock/LC7/MglB family)
MSFLSHLESAVSQVDGALACSVMGFDGIAVETHQVPGATDLELNNTWVEYANLLSQAKATAEALRTGAVQELSISSEKVITLMRMITPEYFIVMALKVDGNYGKGRYVLRVTAPKVKGDLV